MKIAYDKFSHLFTMLELENIHKSLTKINKNFRKNTCEFSLVYHIIFNRFQ